MIVWTFWKRRSARPDLDSLHEKTFMLIDKLENRLDRVEAAEKQCRKDHAAVLVELERVKTTIGMKAGLPDNPAQTYRKQVIEFVRTGHIKEAIRLTESILGDENMDYLSISRRYNNYTRKINEGQSPKELEGELSRICSAINELMTD